MITRIQLFQNTKIQKIESYSQLVFLNNTGYFSCFRIQRYKKLKAIHNSVFVGIKSFRVVSEYKDTKN
ncbi:hypothetical protein HW49_08560 [Porphyromonadaceae bacterium COT-184 OH4590]|nr:hypothetical protein HW49_08560 [Porphyromonadaceae bacterium COT-184 OH4590]